MINSIGGEQLTPMMMIAREGGRIITLGAVTGNVPDFRIPLMFYKQLDIRGTSVGSPCEFDDLLVFVTDHKIHAAISKTFPLAKASEALDFLEERGQQAKSSSKCHPKIHKSKEEGNATT